MRNGVVLCDKRAILYYEQGSFTCLYFHTQNCKQEPNQE